MTCPHVNHANITPPRASLVAAAFLENRVAGRGPLPLEMLRATCNTELAVGYGVLAEQFLLAYAELAGVDPLVALAVVTDLVRTQVVAGEG